MIKLKMRLDWGSKFPSFYYGFGYYDGYSNSFTFFIFPINIFVRIWRAFRYFQTEKWYYLMRKAEIAVKKMEDDK